MNVVLIGYRGTGKTTVGRLLATHLGRILVSLDEEIVREAGMPIPRIVSSRGWEYFRDLEARMVQTFSRMNDLVIDTGGGVILRPTNVTELKSNGYLFWLTAPPDVIIDRIRCSSERPPLTAGKSFLEEVHEVLAEREPLYRAAADTVIDTAGQSPEQVCAQVLSILSEKHLLDP